MYRLLTYGWIILSLLRSSYSSVQEPRLSYALRPGEKYRLEIDIQQNTHSESIRSDEISLYSLIELEFRVDSIIGNDSIYLTATYQELLVSMLAPSLQIDINSGAGKDTVLSAMVNSLEKRPFRVVMNSAGEMLGLKGLAAHFEPLSRYPTSDTSQRNVILNTLHEVYGADAFRSLFSLFVSIYPVVQPIKNWTRDITYYFNTKPVGMVNRYYLTKTTEELVTIQGMGMLNSMQGFHEKSGKREVKSTVSGSQTYDIQADRTTGWVKKCLSRQRLLIESTIIRDPYLPEGLKIPSYTETVFEVKGSRL